MWAADQTPQIWPQSVNVGEEAQPKVDFFVFNCTLCFSLHCVEMVPTMARGLDGFLFDTDFASESLSGVDTTNSPYIVFANLALRQSWPNVKRWAPYHLAQAFQLYRPILGAMNGEALHNLYMINRTVDVSLYCGSYKLCSLLLLFKYPLHLWGAGDVSIATTQCIP